MEILKPFMYAAKQFNSLVLEKKRFWGKKLSFKAAKCGVNSEAY